MKHHLPRLLISLLAISVILASLASIRTVYAQPPEIPRNQAVYYNAAFSPMKGFNILAPGMQHPLGVYEPLFVFDSIHFDLIPWLAKSYEWVDDYTLVVKLRAEPKWQDGEPLTSEDVKYTFELGKRHPEIAFSLIKNIWTYVESIETPDERTVIFHMKKDNPNKLVMRQILTQTPILPKHVWTKIEQQYSDLTEFTNQNPLGSGPYHVIYFSEDKIIFERYEDWWGNSIFGKPAAKYLVGLNVRNNQFCNSLVAKGDLDWSQCFQPKVWELRPNVITWFDHEPWLMPTPDRTGGFMVNLRHYPLNITEFRHAIAWAIDAEEISRKAFSHYAVPIDPSFIRKDSPLRKFVNETAVKQWGFTYDPNKAKQLLDELGFKDTDGDGWRNAPNGPNLEFTVVVVDGWTDWQMACEIFKENMKAIGIKVNVEAMDYPSWADRVRRGDFDFHPAQYDAWDPTGVWGFYRTVFDSRVPNWPMVEGKSSGYKNPEVDKLLDEIGKTPMSDEEKLKQLYGRLIAIIAKDMPLIPVWSWGGIGIYSVRYWVGWPTEDNPYSPAEPGWFAENLLVLINIRPKGGAAPTTPTAPAKVEVPPELEELPSKFAELSNTVSQLSSAVSALSEDISSLSSQLATISGTLSTVIAIQGLTIILLIVVLVLVLRKK